MTLGTNPKLQLNHVSELFPDQKTLEDVEHLDTTTEKVKISMNRPSASLMNYLRSVLTNNYNGSDQDCIMISTPRVIEYELMTLEWAIDLLEYYGKEHLYKRSTLEEDIIMYNSVVNHRMKTVLQYNI